MTVLVTGGAGFIGSNFVLDWVGRGGETVVNLDKLTYAGNMENLASLPDNGRHVFVQGDIGDSSLVQELLDRYAPRAVINFAAESHVDRSILGPEAFVTTNVVGTVRLLEVAHQYWKRMSQSQQEGFRFLHVSTDEVYGSLGADDDAFSEAHRYEPNSPYSASKAASDHFVRAYHQTYGLPVLTTNCSNNYGPFQFPEKLIPLTILNAVSGKQLPVYGDGRQVRDWLHVNDHCRAINTVLEGGAVGEVYNVGGNNQKRNIEVVEAICDLLDELAPSASGQPYRRQITFVRDRPGHDRRYAVNAEKLMCTLKWAPVETFETGLRKTVEWYLNNEQWVRHVTSGEYQQWVKRQY